MRYRAQADPRHWKRGTFIVRDCAIGADPDKDGIAREGFRDWREAVAEADRMNAAQDPEAASYRAVVHAITETERMAERKLGRRAVVFHAVRNAAVARLGIPVEGGPTLWSATHVAARKADLVALGMPVQAFDDTRLVVAIEEIRKAAAP